MRVVAHKIAHQEDSLSFAGLLCNRFVPQLVRLAKPFVVFASLLDTCSCVGASLSSNAEAARSLVGLQVLAPVEPVVLDKFCDGDGSTVVCLFVTCGKSRTA